MNKRELLNYVVNSHVRNELDINELLRLIHLLPDELELNEDQQIVFDWLKTQVEAGCQSFNAIKNMFKGFNAMLTPGEVTDSIMKLSEKERFQVLAAFADYGLEREASE